MNKEKKRLQRNQFSSLSNMQLLTEVIQQSKYCLYCFYCRCFHLLSLTFSSRCCRGASEFIFAAEAPEPSRHVTDFSQGVSVNCGPALAPTTFP